MKAVDLALSQLQEAPWNANRMDEDMGARLRESLRIFGLVENLVVRPVGRGRYEVLSGNQRLRVLREVAVETAPCAVVHLDDARARLLAQALNNIRGEDDLGLRAELIREVLESVPEAEVLALLPETAESLRALVTLGQQDIAAHLAAWQKAQEARLRHIQFQLSVQQLETVEEALECVMRGVTKSGDNPNRRGQALYQLCLDYLRRQKGV